MNNPKILEAPDKIEMTPDEARILLGYYLGPLCVGYSFDELLVIECAKKVVQHSAQEIMRHKLDQLKG